MPHPVPKKQRLTLFPFRVSQKEMDQLISEYLGNEEDNITKFALKEAFPENMLVETQAISCPEELCSQVKVIFSQLKHSMSPDEDLGRKRKDFPADVVIANDLQLFQPGKNSGPLSQHKHNYMECRLNYGVESSQPGYLKTVGGISQKKAEAGFVDMLKTEELDGKGVNHIYPIVTHFYSGVMVVPIFLIGMQERRRTADSVR